MQLDEARITDWRQRIGPLGVWCATDGMRAPVAVEVAQQVEAFGYGVLWLPETLGRDPFAHAAHLAAHTQRLVVASGIASIFHRHPGSMVQAANAVAEQSDGRFVLGIGVSHQPMVEGMRGLSYDKPLTAMRSYLEQMDAAPYLSPPPDPSPPRLLAALGPRMLELASERADGALTYWTVPEHTVRARSTMGPRKLLCVEQKVVLTEDADEAHATAIAALGLYANLPNYRNNWRRLGFSEEEIESRAPRLLDALVAWGTPERVRERIREHHDAGADHVCIQPLLIGDAFRVDRAALEQLAG